MSSEMRELLAEMREDAKGFDQWGSTYWADRLEDILARAEAGADGVEPFGWWIECHGTDGDFGQFVTDRAFVELLRSHGVVERETALFTHPQDASGDAEVAVAALLEIYETGMYPEGHTLAGEHAYKGEYHADCIGIAERALAAMQAKEAK